MSVFLRLSSNSRSMSRCLSGLSRKNQNGSKLNLYAYLNTSSTLSSRNKGSLFGWNLFGNKGEQAEKSTETPVEAKDNEVQEVEWSNVEEVPEVEPITELSPEEKTKIILEQVTKIHPEGQTSTELKALSLEDGKVKFELIKSVVSTLSSASNGFDYQLPNRNLNNISTVSELIRYYTTSQDHFDHMQGHGVSEYVKQLNSKGKLPSNMSFEEFVSEKNTRDFTDKKGKKQKGKYIAFVKSTKPQPSRH